METKNGYFQLVMQNNNTYIRMYPPEGGGEAIRIEELKKIGRASCRERV